MKYYVMKKYSVEKKRKLPIVTWRLREIHTS